jgi:c-di-GMP-binding flagellar brake protein YcgR
MIGHQLLCAKEHNEEVYIWRIVGEKKVLAPVKFELIRKAKGELVVVSSENSKDIFQHVLGGSDHINFFLPKSSLLFQCSVKQMDNDGKLHLQFPKFIAQVERRNNLRMEAIDHPKLRVQFCKTVIAPKSVKQFYGKGLFDLSAGGVTFLITKAESRHFLEGEKLKNVELIIIDQKIVLSASILRVQELNEIETLKHPYKTWKVTLRFDSIQKKDQDLLTKFVFENVTIAEKAV